MTLELDGAEIGGFLLSEVRLMSAISAESIILPSGLFQGVAEAELEQNLDRTFKNFFRAHDEVRGAGREGNRTGKDGFPGQVGACQGLEMSDLPSFL